MGRSYDISKIKEQGYSLARRKGYGNVVHVSCNDQSWNNKSIASPSFFTTNF